jgi:hypothetical protein
MRNMTLALLALSLFITGCKSEKVVMPTGTTHVDVSKVSEGSFGGKKVEIPPAK